MNDSRKSSRKLLLNGARVKFDCGEYSEVEEEAKIIENKRKYKKHGTPDIKIVITVKRIVKEISIKGNDPLITTHYNRYYLSDKVEQKKYLSEIEICKI